MWQWLAIGLIIGVLIALPVAAAWSRRTARRVRQLEQRARTAERLAELGTLTGGLAHEIKNPLSTLGLNVQLLQEDLEELAHHLPDDHGQDDKLGRIRRRFEALLRETQRLRDILEDFLRFAGRVQLDLAPVDLNAVVDALADFFEPQASAAGVRLRTQLWQGPATVPADEGLLKQALLNLLINATQAMAEARQKNKPHGGADELHIRIEPQRGDGDGFAIRITDTGPGIAPDVLEKIFQPYFSTKRGGTGLGLPTARRIVEEHGGRLEVHSEPGRGSDFRVVLPVMEEQAAVDR